MSRSSIDIPVVSKFDPTGIRQAQKALGGFGKSLMGFGAIVAGAFAIRAIGNFAAETIRMAEEVQQSEAVLRQVAKTTGVFGSEVDSVTKRLIAFANAQELRIGVDSEVIKVVQAQLLSFKGLAASAGQAGGSFDRATKAAFDMAMVLKKDASSQALALGKALENPIKGVTALARGGTTFTDQQREQIRTLVESNRLLDAQALILTEVESQYGGAAEAGALYSDRFRLGLEQIKETIGIALIPTFERFVEFFITNVVPPLTKFFEEDFPVMLQSFGAAAEGIATSFGPIGAAIKEALEIPENVTLLEGFLDKIAAMPENPLFQELVQSIVDLTPALLDLLPPLTDLIINLVPLLIELTPALIGLIDGLTKIFGFVADEAERAAFKTTNFNEEVRELALVALENIPVVGGWVRVFGDIFRAIDRAVKRLSDFIRVSGGMPAGTRLPIPSTTGAEARALGGPVSAMSSYLVGERGPELFTPGANGFITPNNRLGGGGGNTYNITINANVADARLGEIVVNSIKRYERVSGPVFASA